MDIFFENIYTDNPQIMLEVAKILPRPRRTIWLTVYWVLAVLYGLIVVFDGSLKNWCLFLFFVGYLIWFILLPRTRTRKYMKSITKYYNGTIPQTRILFTGDKIISQSGEDHTATPYDKLVKVHFGKYAIIFTVEGNASIFLSTHGFTRGTVPEFLDFLHTKCPQLKLPNWQW